MIKTGPKGGGQTTRPLTLLAPLVLALGACASLTGVPAGDNDAGTTGGGGGTTGGGTGGATGVGTGGTTSTGTGGTGGTGGRTGTGGSPGPGGATGTGGTQGTSTRVDLTGKKVLFIVGSPTSPSTGDMSFQTTLEGKGMVVTVADTSVANPNAATMDLIIASDTAGSTFPTLYGGVAVPMIIFGNSLMQGMGMIAASSGKGSISTPVMLTIVDTSTRLAGGLATGTSFSAIGTTRNTSIYWGTPGGSPIKVAAVTATPTQLTVFAYEKGAMMALGTAADRRVALAFKTDAVSDLSIEAFKMLNAAIEWTAARL